MPSMWTTSSNSIVTMPQRKKKIEKCGIFTWLTLTAVLTKILKAIKDFLIFMITVISAFSKHISLSLFIILIDIGNFKILK